MKRWSGLTATRPSAVPTHDIAVQYLDATLGGEASDEEFEVEVAKLAPEIAYYRAITALDPARPRARAEKPAAKGSKPRAVPETEGPPAETGAASGDSAS